MSCNNFHDLITTIISFILLSVPLPAPPPCLLSLLICPPLSRFVGVEILPSKRTKVVLQLSIIEGARNYQWCWMEGSDRVSDRRQNQRIYLEPYSKGPCVLKCNV